MAVTISTYNHTARKLLALSITNEAANFYCELLNSSASFSATHTTKAQVDNSGAYEVSGNGWPAGGQPLASVAVTTVTTNDAMIDAADISVTATGGAIGPASAALIYVNEGNAGTTLTPLWFVNFGESKTAPVGTVFPVVINASGLAQITV